MKPCVACSLPEGEGGDGRGLGAGAGLEGAGAGWGRGGGTGHVERAKRWCLQAKTPAFFAGLRAGQEGGGGGGREGRKVGGEMRTSAQGAVMVSALALDGAKAP